MTDIVVTVARESWPNFLAEHGAGTNRGRMHVVQFYGERPQGLPGDQLYIVSHGRVRCALLIDRIMPHAGGWQIIASMLRPVTLAGYVGGFPDCRRRWWNRPDELPFDAWRTEAVSVGAADVPDYAHGKSRAEQGGASA
jgi:hypothetical protein